jgi:virginiamycin B lyase
MHLLYLKAMIVVATVAALTTVGVSPVWGATPSAISVNAMAAGPDGNVWFTIKTANEVGKITPSGTLTLYPVSGNVQPSSIVAGPGGDLYFTESNGPALGRITTGGTISQIALPPGGGNDQSTAKGPGGTIWFANYSEVLELTSAGKIVVHHQPASQTHLIWQIAVASNGYVWFTSQDRPRGSSRYALYQLTPAGKEVAHLEPSGQGPGGWLTIGPDANIWFGIAGGADEVVRMTPAGKVTVFPLSKNCGWAGTITSGPGHDVWVAQSAMNAIFGVTPHALPGCIDQITTAGKITTHVLTTTSFIGAITAGPDGNVWFPDSPQGAAGSIDRLTIGGQLSHFPFTASPSSPPIPITLSLTAQVARNSDQTLHVSTAPGAQIVVQAQLPDSTLVNAQGTADTAGAWTYSWQVTSASTGTATVRLTVTSGSTVRHFTKTFQVI